MKKYLKSVILILVIALGLGAIANVVQTMHHLNLENKVLEYESRILTVVDQLEVEIDEVDTVGIKQQKDELLKIQQEVKEEIEDTKDTEQLLFTELDIMLSYSIETIDAVIEVIENPWSLVTGVPEQKFYNIEKQMKEHGALYKQYKQELEIESNGDLQLDIAIDNI